jgi:hypothetical protein
MEEEFVVNQERLKPREEKTQVPFADSSHRLLPPPYVVFFLTRAMIANVTGGALQGGRSARDPDGRGQPGGDH